MNEQGLKALENLGAELGAAKAENEAMREALHWYAEKVAECRKIGSLGDNARQALDLDGGFRARDALPRQADHLRDATQMMVPSEIIRAIAWGDRDDAAEAIGNLRCLLADPDGEDEVAFPDSPEPTDTFTAVDMATAAAQGFRDGQAAVEPAPAQDEREAFDLFPDQRKALAERLKQYREAHKDDVCSPQEVLRQCKAWAGSDQYHGTGTGDSFQRAADLIEALLATRPAQTAPQPELVMPVALGSVNADYDKGWADHAAEVVRLNAAPQPEQSGLPDPRQWTDQQVLDFLGVALRNVDVVGTVQLNEIRQGFELVMGRAALSAQGAGDADS